MGQVILAFLVKHWTKVVPLLVGLALAWCVREQIRAGAKAEAYQRVAAMTAKYSQQQEAERVKMKQVTEDTIAHLNKALVNRAPKQHEDFNKAQEWEAQLRHELQGNQRTALDSMASKYQQVIVSLKNDKNDLQDIVRLRNQQLTTAERLLADSQRYNGQLQTIINSERPSNGPWKAIAAVSTVAAVVIAIVK